MNENEVDSDLLLNSTKTERWFLFGSVKFLSDKIITFESYAARAPSRLNTSWNIKTMNIIDWWSFYTGFTGNRAGGISLTCIYKDY